MEKNDKRLELEKLYSEYADEFAGEELVFGDGNFNSGIVMIGEAPGKDEVVQGRPFVGLAGGKLKEFMDYINLSRKDLYITNAIKYRLFKVNPKTGRKSNRPAGRVEIRSSMGFLSRELHILQPSLVISLGNVPLKAVTSEFNNNIGVAHGRVIMSKGLRLFPLYHPASLIYNRDLEKVYFEDLDKLKQLLKEKTE